MSFARSIQAATAAGVPYVEPLHTPGAHQLAAADWVEVPATTVRRHCLGGAFFISKAAEAFLAGQGLPLDVVLCWFNQPRGAVEVGESLQMGQGLEAFFGFDEAQSNARAFFVEITLRDDPLTN